VVDCRFNLRKPEAGRQAWELSHIPGAFYADLDQDLAAPKSAGSGRHPLPDAEQFAALLGSWGVTLDTHVVVYDASGGAIAARLWWLLRWVGHEQVSLLDGGYPAWQRQKLPVSADQPALGPGNYPVQPGRMPVVQTADVELGLAEGTLALLDARDADRFAGKVEPIDKLAGHIPGARNRPFQINLDALGRFRGVADLQESFSDVLSDTDRRLASMCGSGVTACQNLFAMGLAGVDFTEAAAPALYVGSWSEWIRSSDRPVELNVEVETVD
jgi:thiosulfate/3-mercaptopyruvate sulfurtransferase